MRRLLVLGCLVSVGCATAATEQPPPQIAPPAVFVAPAAPAPAVLPQPPAVNVKPSPAPSQKAVAPVTKPAEPSPAPPTPPPQPPPPLPPPAPSPPRPASVPPIAKPAEPRCAGRLKRECLAGCAWVPGSSAAGRILKGYCEKAGPIAPRPVPPPRSAPPPRAPALPADACTGRLMRECLGACRWIKGSRPATGVQIRGYCTR